MHEGRQLARPSTPSHQYGDTPGSRAGASPARGVATRRARHSEGTVEGSAKHVQVGIGRGLRRDAAPRRTHGWRRGRDSNDSATQGVTKDSIKVGIAIVDYDSIKDFVDFSRGDQEKIAQTFVDSINKNGGVDGRKIIPVYKEYPPIPGQKPDPLSLCTSWAEDDKVFAVLGVFIDFTGQAQLCLTREHHVIHIGHELDQPWIDDSPGGLLLTSDATKERGAEVLVTLLSETGKLKGKKVAVLASKNGEQRAEDTIVPALREHDVKLGSTGILTLTGPETEASRSQLQAFIERWKTEKVNAVFMSGLDVTSKGYTGEIKKALPQALLITDASATVHEASDEVIAGTKPNPYDGMLSVLGVTASERWAKKNPLLQRCVDTYEKASGTKVPGPTEERWSTGRRSRSTSPSPTSAASCSCSRPSPRRSAPNLDHRKLAEDRRCVLPHRPCRRRPPSPRCAGEVRGRRRLPVGFLRSRARPVGRLEAAVTPVAGRQRRPVRQGRQLGDRRRVRGRVSVGLSRGA